MTKPKIRPQRRNANRHTQRGMGMLEGSIERDGIIGALTVAADDEVFDGSARAETLPAMGFDLTDVAQVVKAEPGRVLIIESDGSSPLVHRRVDIPSADDPKAQRLGVAANRVAQVNLDFDPGVLAEVHDEAGLGALFFPDELKDLAQPSAPEPGGGGDDFDATPDDGPTRAQLGDLWVIGGVHRLLVGDCTDPANVARLMGGERAAVCFTSPPYNVGVSAQLSGNTHLDDSLYADSDDDLTDGKYLELLSGFTRAALEYCDYVFVNVQPLAGNKVALIEYQYAFRDHFADVAIWNKGHAAPLLARRVMNSQFEYIFIFAPKNRPSRAVGTSDWRGIVSNVYDGPPQRNNEYAEIHGATMPIHVPTWICGTFTRNGDAIYEPFAGTGTTLIAAHRTGRCCYGMEIAPRYADVILRRAEAEGLTVERVEAPHEAAVTP